MGNTSGKQNPLLAGVQFPAHAQAANLTTSSSTRRLRVLSLYATNFGDLSRGGIRSFIDVISRGAPPQVDLTHVGLGPLAGQLPRSQDHYIGLGSITPTSRINLRYGKALTDSGRAVFADADLVLAHRAEHVAFIPRKMALALTLHGATWYAWRARRSLFGLVYPAVELAATLRADVTMSVSSGEHGGLFNRYAKHVEGITTTYDAALFTAGAATPRPERPAALIAMARLVPEKRLELVIDTARNSGVGRALLFGEGPERQRLLDYAARSGVQLDLPGHSPATEIADCLRNTHGVFVNTSLFEGFPVAMLEAAATGTPVVGLAAPGVSAAVLQVGGHLANSAQELGAAVAQAWQSGNRLSADDIRERFGPDQVAHQFWVKALRVTREGSGATT